ncbi:hypothetical protein CcaCcLH18_07662 [Colletotrichum camelliae]|nr:hypothetical protein CcaCcLH18_07662 [Colletotrichum camelliae]
MERLTSTTSSDFTEGGHTATRALSAPSEESSLHADLDDDRQDSTINSRCSQRLERLSSGERNALVESEGFVTEPCSLHEEHAMNPTPTEIGEYKFTYRKNHFAFGTVLTDFAVVILPLAILIFSIKIWCLNGSVTSTTSFAQWQSAITLLGTIFPILFASVIGRLLSELARWNLENGSSMGLLEQLMGSRTVGSTVQTIIQLRTANIIAAILRMAKLQLESTEEDGEVSHFDLFAPAEFNLGAGKGGSRESPVAQGNFIGLLASLYTTLVMAPSAIKTDPMDLWGNVKIPFLANDTGNNWQNTSTDVSEIVYSSLVGIPTILGQREGNHTFEIESSYIDLQCSKITRCGPSTCEERPFKLTEKFMLEYDPPNGTWNGFGGYRKDSERHTSWSIALDRFVDRFWQQPWNEFYSLNSPTIFFNQTGVRAGATHLLIQIQFSPGSDMVVPDSAQAVCGVTQKVIAQRKSTKDYPPKDISQLSFPTTFRHISDQLPLAATRDGWVGNSKYLSIYYTTDPLFEKVGSGDKGLGMNLADIDDNEFGPRFNQLLNTYVMLGQMKLLVMSAGATQQATFQPNVTTNATIISEVEIFEVSKTWIVTAQIGVQITADAVKTYPLENSEEWFEEATKQQGTRLWMERQVDRGSKMYMVVGLATVINATFVQAASWEKQGDVDIHAPVNLVLTAAGVVVPVVGEMLDSSVGTEIGNSEGQTSSFVAKGDNIDNLRLSNTQWFSLDMRRDEEYDEDDVMDVRMEDLEDDELEGTFTKREAEDGSTLILPD